MDDRKNFIWESLKSWLRHMAPHWQQEGERAGFKPCDAESVLCFIDDGLNSFTLIHSEH